MIEHYATHPRYVCVRPALTLHFCPVTDSPLLPYHSLPMKKRFELRKTWLRWGFAVILPFLLSTPVAVLLLAPALLLVEVFGKEPWVFLLAGVVVAGWTALVRRVAVRYTLRLTFRREDKLRAYLSDPTLG